MITVDGLKLLRNILLRCFVIGAVFVLMTLLVSLWGWKFWENLLVNQLQLANRETLSSVTLSYLASLRFFLGYCLLTPGLALHWTVKRLEQQEA